MLKNILFASLLLIGLILVADAKDEFPIKFLALGLIDQCEGNYSNVYKFVQQYADDVLCLKSDYSSTSSDFLISRNKDGSKDVSELYYLSLGLWPAGAYYNFDLMYLVIGGNLKGNFIYIRQKYLVDNYNKICSSVLGISANPIYPLELLIAEDLDPNIVANSPNGVYPAFKKSASTICNGRGWNLQA